MSFRDSCSWKCGHRQKPCSIESFQFIGCALASGTVLFRLIKMPSKKKKPQYQKYLPLPKVDTSLTPIQVSSRKIIPLDLYCDTLHEFLLDRPADELNKFYEYASVCVAVYRELPEYAKYYIMRALLVEHPIPQAVITSWGNKEWEE